jgi:hypothetical protein
MLLLLAIAFSIFTRTTCGRGELICGRAVVLFGRSTRVRFVRETSSGSSSRILPDQVFSCGSKKFNPTGLDWALRVQKKSWPICDTRRSPIAI